MTISISGMSALELCLIRIQQEQHYNRHMDSIFGVTGQQLI